MNTNATIAGKSLISSVVLAEDDADDREVFEQVLKDMDTQIKVDYVTDGIKLMDLLAHFLPDLLFLDLDMPRKNGLECLVEIRNQPITQHLPVIVFSSTTRPANIQTAYDMGAHLFLIKSALYGEYVASLKAIFHMDWSNPEAIKEKYCVQGRYTAFS
jgi:CheY-like chemotaxis protein